MGAPAIRVEQLSKMYRIGAREQQPKTTAGSLKQAAMSPIAYLRRTLRPPREEEIFWALRDISFEVQPGEVIGIIGRNGAGKSTLLKILSRITEPTSGRAVIKGRVGSLLEVGTGFHPELTGRENIYLNGTMLGMKGREIKKQFDEIVDFSGVEKFLDTPVKRYSSGMYVRLAFAVAAHLEPEILIIDEVLSVGDAEFQKKCLGKMEDVATEGRTILFVSHNMAAVQNLCHHGMVLTKGRVHSFGPIEEAVHSYIQNVQTAAIRADLAQRTDRKGTQWLKFTKAAICNSAGNELQQVMSGQDVRIKLYYLSEREKPSASVLISFNVRSSQGYLLTNLNSADTGHTLLDIHSSGYFECYWPKLQLRSGRYDCNLFCSVNGEIVDWLQNAFIITVEDGDYYGTGKLIERTQGDILIDHRWTAGSSTLLSEHERHNTLSMQGKTLS